MSSDSDDDRRRDPPVRRALGPHPGEAGWVPGALAAVEALRARVCRDIEQALQDVTYGVARSPLILDEPYAAELVLLVHLRMGPAVLAHMMNTGLRLLLDTFPPEHVLAPPPAPPPRPGDTLMLDLSLGAKAVVWELAEQARTHAIRDSAADLTVTGPGDLTGSDDVGRDAPHDPDCRADPADLDIPDRSGDLTDVDIAVALGRYCHDLDHQINVAEVLFTHYVTRTRELYELTGISPCPRW